MPRRDFSKVAFAATGDTNSIPTPTQADGSVSLQQGFTFDYQRDNGAGGGTPDPLAKNIDREDMNGILNEITASVGEIQQNGFPAWVVTAAPYPINSCVRYNDINYRSLIANNSVTPGTDVTKWTIALNTQAINGQSIYTTSGTFIVPANVFFIDVSGCGGGGGGGGTFTVAGQSAGGAGGGGAGESRLKTRFAVTPGQSIAITIGTGGGAGSIGGFGGNGTATIIGSLITLQPGLGGSPGSPASTTASPGGQFGSGFPGGSWGGDAQVNGNGAGAYGGPGADSLFGVGGRLTKGNSGAATAGGAGSGYGAGGGGAGGSNANQSGSGAIGGAGTNGIVIIEYSGVIA